MCFFFICFERDDRDRDYIYGGDGYERDGRYDGEGELCVFYVCIIFSALFYIKQIN